ncbi:maltose O-acetyltransferase [Rubritalea squalenifaciens DSM 18772]|uniref:Maltose O-acetyltransferase n=1 Tax=Rubritalea squalenifaciens DSM 18772 TaxID=1123071 RepID=A0A1M6E6X5_9BACT|nr:sugar O-acetyltransferase [Rubritalea squalenifaciens]SHI81284.1 maltose O-acetyltransferase [Rubritalea squalenifaciens DSM 18772]
MTEREKMLRGESYNSRDAELLELYWQSRQVIQDFNAAIAEKDRMRYLEPCLHELGAGVWVEAPFHCEYGAHISIGERTYVGAQCFFQDSNWIKIGCDGLIGAGLRICCADHPVSSGERVLKEVAEGQASYVTSSKPVTIGDRVWIGASVTIIGGVTIGDDCVIGAGSVVTRDIPSGSTAYGVPCRVSGKS